MKRFTGVLSEAGRTMTIVRYVALVIIAFQGSTFTASQGAVKGAHDGSLDELRGKTGWISLGDVTPDQKRWATGSDPRVEYFAGAFEYVDKVVDRRKPVLPKVGDRIRLTARRHVIILDFASTGERRALDDPSNVDRSATASEFTGIILPQGSVVEVRQIRVSRTAGAFRTVWARIVPAGIKTQ